MKPRHAAVLALVGWCMMFPPIDPKSRFDPSVTEQQLDLKAPLNEWWIGDKFDDFDQCKAALASMHMKQSDFWFGKILCVSSDDTRLQGKSLKFVPDTSKPDWYREIPDC